MARISATLYAGSALGSFLCCLCASWLAMGSTTSSDVTDGKLLLFSNHHSYYARKVLLTLEEKKVPYKVHRVDLMKGEQYEPWFMKINPRGEIPVLQDGSVTVADSKKIIDYLNDGFSQGDYINLVPDDVAPSVREKISALRSAIDTMEGNMILFGLLYHPKYVSAVDRHYPYNLPGIMGTFKANVDEMPNKLRSLAEKYPEYKELLQEKAARAENTKRIVQSEDEFDKELKVLEALFSNLEQELQSKGSQESWLTGDRFTQADVSLTILMDRLWRVGAAEYLWGKHPYLKRYFERVQKREAYIAIDPTFWDDVPTLWPYIAAAATLIILLIAALCSIPLLIKKYSNKS